MKNVKKALAVMFVIALVFSFVACDDKTTTSTSPSASNGTIEAPEASVGTTLAPGQTAAPQQSLVPGQTAAPEVSVEPGQTNTASNTYFGIADEKIFGEYTANGGSFELQILGNEGKLTYTQVDSEGSFENISKLIITGPITVSGNKVEMNTEMFTQGVTHSMAWEVRGDVENYDELMQQFKVELLIFGLTEQQADDFCNGKPIILTEALGDFVDVGIEHFSYKSFKADITGDNSFAFTEMLAHSAYPSEENVYVTYYSDGAVKEITKMEDPDGNYKCVESYNEDGVIISTVWYHKDIKGNWEQIEQNQGTTEVIKPLQPSRPSEEFDDPSNDEDNFSTATNPDDSTDIGSISGGTVLKPGDSDVSYGDIVTGESGSIVIRPDQTDDSGTVVIKPIGPNSTVDNYFDFISGADTSIVGGNNFSVSFGTLPPQ